jgi:peptidoglycan/xylan/chitin deacetylase (PgdA/CDA1 family)
MITLSQSDGFPRTPDGRYFVVRGRLWRMSNPELAPDKREQLVRELMAARRAVRAAQGDPAALRAARARVDEAKRALGERGPVWWTDGAPDYNRRLAKNSPYADWFADLTRSGDER